MRENERVVKSEKVSVCGLMGERERLLLSTAFNVELQSKRFISIGPKVSAKIVQTKKLSAKKVPDRGVLNKKKFLKILRQKFSTELCRTFGLKIKTQQQCCCYLLLKICVKVRVIV